jgi:flagellar basal body-associated protein FliL
LRRASLLLVVVVLLILGGYLSVAISKQGAEAVPGIKVQTENPEASPFSVTTDKGAAFFLFIMVSLGSVVGMGVTLAILFWFLNRGVAKARLGEKPKPAASAAAATANQSEAA